MQRFIGPIFTEGIMSTGIMAIGRALTDPEVSVVLFHRRVPD
jgi:transformation/transcription domain-associated protein